MDNKRHNMRALIIVLLASIALGMLIFCSFPFEVIWRLGCCIFLGFIVGILFLPKIYASFKKIKILEWVNLFIGCIGLMVAFLLFFPSNFKEKLDNIFDKQICYNVDDFFQNENETHFIFGFDKTEYNKSDISPYISESEDLPKLYDKYCKKANITKKENVKYREFCKAKMCYDLIRFMENNKSNDKFSIYTIGQEVETLIEDKYFSKNDIENAIEAIEYVNYNAKETHFEKYYEKIHNIAKNQERNKFTFVKYVVYTYSDFVYDKNTNTPNSDNLKINKYRYGTEHIKGFPDLSIIENLFIMPHNDKNTNKKFCIINEKEEFYESRIIVKDITRDEEFGNVVQNQKYQDVVIYFSGNEFSSPNLEFTDNLYKIRLHQKEGKVKTYCNIRLTNTNNKEEYITLSNTFEPIKKAGKYAIMFKGTKAEFPFIEIVREDIHVILELKPEENKTTNKSIRFIIVGLLVFFGISIPNLVSIVYSKIK